MSTSTVQATLRSDRSTRLLRRWIQFLQKVRMYVQSEFLRWKVLSRSSVSGHLKKVVLKQPPKIELASGYFTARSGKLRVLCSALLLRAPVGKRSKEETSGREWGYLRALGERARNLQYQVFPTVDGRRKFSLANVCAVQALERKDRAAI